MLEKLKLLLDIKNNEQDKLLNLLLDISKDLVLNYTKRNEILKSFENIIVSLAVIYYNRMGAEGESSRREGGIDRNFITDIPSEIKLQLNPYRIVKVVGMK